MEKVEVEFKFRIGEKVHPAVNPGVTLQVLNRTVEQCIGGIQKFYTCQSEYFFISSKPRDQTLLRLQEIELISQEEAKGLT